MFLRRAMSQQCNRVFGSRSGQSLLKTSVCNSNAHELPTIQSLSHHPQVFHSLSGGLVDSTGKVHNNETAGLSLLGSCGVLSSSNKVKGNVALPCTMSMRSYIHSGIPKEFDAGQNYTNTNFPRSSIPYGDPIESEAGWNYRNTGGMLDRRGNSVAAGFSFSRHNVEQNADIVHIKMLRNNTFVTVTDSKGNKKFGVSAGKLTDRAGKVSRYAAEACAEQVGRDIRGRGIKSVVVKVNGFTFFKKKKQAILGIREGYSHSRGDKSPIVYIEDTTRRPHNGCRLRKKRRV